ncbi:peptide ABC transporter substrate-binding protein [Lactiplantibacillus sp. WILCCON 0030]|uniref:Peptide ABC transporter substrate-binding protein n=1 Tax=Lactiplantibacillus brownii TaxID=3069269 RepID=A0ABU1A6Y3_9LACO|nr:peptide ABC transporter substrate-binding protein [Lactiplantibacillus brownii]MDQ7936095.1 peptide ABC transporter substrate-binding protein [Lactiplantibacillus brownii]
MSFLNHKKSLLLGGSLILIGGIAFTVHANAQPATHPTSQSINLYEKTTLTSLDASKITDSVSNSVLSEVDEGLYRLNQNSQPVNALATKTTVSKDGKTYTIDLRHNGHWSNGDPVTAQDFVYSWERALNPKTKSEFTYLFTNIKNADAIAAGKLAPNTLGAKATNNYQLKITLSKPAAYFKQVLAGVTFYPINQHAVQKYGQNYGTTAGKTVYNGAFTLSGWTGTNDHWTLTKNPHYQDKKAVKLNHISYQVVKSSTTAYNLYQANKLDMVTLTGEQNVQNKHNADLKTLSAGQIGFIQYNQKDKTAANQNLRAAISLAINRQQLTKTVLENGSVPAKTFAVTNMLKNPQTGHDFVSDATVKDTATLDLTQATKRFKTAKQQLHQKQLSLTITCGDDDTTHQAAEFIQGQLTSHLKGLKVTVRAMPFNAMLTKVSQGDFQLNLTSWSMDFADPSQALTILTSKSNSNMGHYHNSAYDQAMTDADGKDALNAPARYQDLVQAAKTAMQDQAVTPLYEGGSNVLIKPHLKGVVINKFSGAMNYRTAYIN